jgi:RNA-binding protein
MTELTKPQRAHLRKLANPLKPTVMLGRQGLTEALVEKIGQELEAHELIKLRLLDHKDQKDQLAQTIVDETGAALVSIVGNVVTLFRPSSEPERQRINLPGPNQERGYGA